MKANILLPLLLFCAFLNSIQALTCDGKTIDHCIKCDTGENSDSCSTCDSGYFQFFNNLLCMKCNDPIYGQIGCEGNCDGTNYLEARNVICEKDGCKEGYYNIDGFCLTCSEVSPGCSKCSYEETVKGNFSCTKCLNDDYYLSNGECKDCSLPYCKKCYYNNTTEIVECDRCEEGYYKNSMGKCVECYNIYFFWGYCKVCSENDTENDTCFCAIGFAKNGNTSCINCPQGCSECNYDNKIDSFNCTYCWSDYALDSDKRCIKCCDGCNDCELDDENNPICKSCESGTFSDINVFLVCPFGCSK